MMGSLTVRMLSALAAATISLPLLGSGIAYADALTGQKYSDAKATISKWNGTPVIATVSGDQLETDNCVVTSWHKSRFLDASGRDSRSKEYLVHLNCNNVLASAGHPGNSSMSPEGAGEKRNDEAAANINKNPAWCKQSDENAQYCERICKSTGLCEV
jgi:hypothetical protein